MIFGFPQIACTQFPTSGPKLEEYWWNATGARYDDFDNAYNIEIDMDAATVAANSGRLGNQLVYLTNSAGGLRAMKMTAKTTKNNIAEIVTYESIGYVFPIGVPLEDFKKLAKLKNIQFSGVIPAQRPSSR